MKRGLKYPLKHQDGGEGTPLKDSKLGALDCAAELLMMKHARHRQTGGFPLIPLQVETSPGLGCDNVFNGCETWTLLPDSDKRIRAFKTKCLRKLLCISYLEHQTNDRARSKINFLVSPQELLLATVKRPKLARFRNVTRHDSLF